MLESNETGSCECPLWIASALKSGWTRDSSGPRAEKWVGHGPPGPIASAAHG